jgi:hypothetical protein
MSTVNPVFAALILVACSQQAADGRQQASLPPKCESLAPIAAAPAGTGLSEGVLLDHLFLTATWRDSFRSGYPTKVAIHATAPVSLTGSRCSDGRPLRFWYRDGLPPLGQLPAPTSAIEKTGDLIATLSTDSVPNESHTGYVLFPTGGRYMISSREDGKPLSTVVVEVTAG